MCTLAALSKRSAECSSCVYESATPVSEFPGVDARTKGVDKKGTLPGVVRGSSLEGCCESPCGRRMRTGGRAGWFESKASQAGFEERLN